MLLSAVMGVIDLAGFIDLLNDLLPAFLALGIVTVFIPSVINLLKHFGLPDGQATVANMILELALFTAFVGAKLLAPSFDITSVDTALVKVAGVITSLITFLVQMGLSKAVYQAFWRKLTGPLGFSYSK